MDNQDTSDSQKHNNTLKSLETQEGGTHYQGFVIQPAEYIVKNKLTWLEGNVVKYASRHKNKNGAQDIKKAIQCLKIILEIEYGE
jgi:hypothetical protein